MADGMNLGAMLECAIHNPDAGIKRPVIDGATFVNGTKRPKLQDMAVNMLQMFCCFAGQWSNDEMGALPSRLPVEMFHKGRTFRIVKFELGGGATPERLQEMLPMMYDVLSEMFDDEHELLMEVVSKKYGCDFLYVPCWIAPDVLADLNVTGAAGEFADRLGYLETVAALPAGKAVLAAMRESMKECGFVPAVQRTWGMSADRKDAKRLAEMKKLSRVTLSPRNGLAHLSKCLEYEFGIHYPAPLYEVRGIYSPESDSAALELCPILPAGTDNDRITDVWDVFRKKMKGRFILIAPANNGDGTELVLCGKELRTAVGRLRDMGRLVNMSQRQDDGERNFPDVTTENSPADVIPADGTVLGGYSVREIIRELRHRGVKFGNGEIRVPVIHSKAVQLTDEGPAGTAYGTVPAGGGPTDSAPHDGTPLGDASVRDIIGRLKGLGAVFGTDGMRLRYVRMVTADIADI